MNMKMPIPKQSHWVIIYVANHKDMDNILLITINSTNVSK